MIVSRKYELDDYWQLAEWWAARKIVMAEDVLPPTGFIVPGIAAGFLIKTDTSCCIIEPFIANPRANKEDRDAALNKIMLDLIEEARFLGFKRIFGFSSRESMIERALNCGYVIVEESTTVCKELM